MFVINSLIYIVCSYTLFCNKFTETEDKLRENIKELTEGNLDFKDNNKISVYKNELPDMTPKNESEYDFIVIGAGSAGATIASRLSEIKTVKVLLIEAGIKEYPIMDIPLMAPSLQFSDQINWKYKTESSEKYCLGLENSQCNWPRGKVMGGSSVLNFMVATRGNKKDYDDWAKITNDKSWSYKRMLRYFKKLENFNVTNVEVNWDLHNKNGPMHITSPPYNTKLGKAFVSAGEEIGYPMVDYNGKEQVGFSYFQSTIYNGERWSTNRGYLHSIKNRKNLFLTRDSFVTKILINEDTKEAYGVKFIKNNRGTIVKARKEIILCAGAINSPQLLMLSGIGPKEHLNDLDIKVIQDLPVGRNLMDHIAYGGLIFKVNDSETFHNVGLLDPQNPDIKNYITKRNGSLALGSGFEALGYLNVFDPNPDNLNPNIELVFAPSSGTKDPLISKMFGIKEEYQEIMNADIFNHSAYTIMPMLMHPRSRGKLLLKSKNPFVKPKLYPNYLDDPYDVATMVRGIRMTLELTKTKTLQKYGSELYNIPLPCDDYDYNTDSYWECAIRTYTYTVYHQSGTCKMGRENDESSVVNSKLQVKGIKNLRVADASIMPKIVSAHPNIPIIAIGEKISDVIKKQWKLI